MGSTGEPGPTHAQSGYQAAGMERAQLALALLGAQHITVQYPRGFGSHADWTRVMTRAATLRPI